MRKILGLIPYAALLFLVYFQFAQPAKATTLNLSDCSQSSLATQWNSMTSGAYVLVFPSCAAGASGNWTAQLNLNSLPSAVTSVTLQGNTSVNCTGTPGTSTWACTATDNTVISDSYQATCCSNQLLLMTTGQTSTVFRITGITFQGGNIGSVNNNKQPAIQFGGNSQSFRIDHCHFNWNTYSPQGGMAWLRTVSDIRGVLDHNVVDLGGDSSVSVGFEDYGAAYDSIGQGDGGWATSSNWGTSAFLFMENNVFTGGAPNDCGNAGRYVMRYNTINKAFIGVQDHATKSQAGTARGCREQEIYHNYFSGSPAIGTGLSAIGLKGAPALIWDNILASGYNELVDLQTDRNSGATTETNTPNGWGYCGTTNPNNTGHVISNWDGNNSATGWPCLDGIGRGYDAQSLNGASSFPSRLNSSTGTIAWPQQYLEPVYVWMSSILNGGNNTIIGGSNGSPDIQNNRDFYSDNGSCAPNGCTNLTTGTGYGTLAQRPTSCTPGPGGTFGKSPTGSYGVAYWATDADTLYICTASPGTWTAVYTPYTYPHPLDGGGGGGNVTLGPSANNFGSVNLGSSSAAVTFTVTNGSASSMTSFTQTVTGTNSADFAISNNTCGASLAAGSSCTLQITFTPGAAGARSATLNATYSGGDGASPQTSALSGTGVSVACTNTSLGAGWGCVTSAGSSTGSSGTSLSLGPFPVNPPIGALIVATGFNGSNAPCAAPSDSLVPSGNWHLIVSATVSADSLQLCAYWGVTTSTGTDTVTLNAGATASEMGGAATVYTAPAGTLAIDKTCSNSNAVSATGSNNAACSSGYTNAGSNDLNVFASYGDFSSTLAAGTNYTLVNAAANLRDEYYMQAVASAITPAQTIASSLNYGAMGASFGIQGPVTISPTSFNFGSVAVSSSSSPETFTLTNNSLATASSISLTLTGGNAGDFSITNTGAGSCSAAGNSLAPAASCTFTATFSPTATGARSTTLSVAYSGGDGASPVTASLTGTGSSSGSVTLNPASFNFGSVNVGSSSTAQTFTLNNTTGSSMTSLSAPTLGGANQGDWSTSSNTCTSTLASNSSCTVKATFTPTATGARSATLTFTYSGGDGLGSHSSTLTGTGTSSGGTVTITAVSPTSGVWGTIIAITGTGFGTSQGGSTVTFNGHAATCLSWTATAVTCYVPAVTSATGNVVVTVSSNASNPVTFTLSPLPVTTAPIF